MGGVIRAVLASANENKLRELRHALDGWSLELLGAAEYPPEDGPTYLDNARGKAEFARTLVSDRWVLGEDSGLRVDGLGGGPGIRSARYAGEDATDRENLERLLADLEGASGPARLGRYVCEIVLLAPDGRELRADGDRRGDARERRWPVPVRLVDDLDGDLSHRPAPAR